MDRNSFKDFLFCSKQNLLFNISNCLFFFSLISFICRSYNCTNGFTKSSTTTDDGTRTGASGSGYAAVCQWKWHIDTCGPVTATISTTTCRPRTYTSVIRKYLWPHLQSLESSTHTMIAYHQTNRGLRPLFVGARKGEIVTKNGTMGHHVKLSSN